MPGGDSLFISFFTDPESLDFIGLDGEGNFISALCHGNKDTAALFLLDAAALLHGSNGTIPEKARTGESIVRLVHSYNPAIAVFDLLDRFQHYIAVGCICQRVAVARLSAVHYHCRLIELIRLSNRPPAPVLRVREKGVGRVRSASAPKSSNSG